MSKALKTACFLLFLSLWSAVGGKASYPVPTQGQGSYTRHSPTEVDTAENADEHVQESIEQFLRKSHR